MTTVLISVVLLVSLLLKVYTKPVPPQLPVKLISLDINPKGVSRTVFERSEFTPNQREAIGILEKGDIKMFNDYCSEVKLKPHQIDQCKQEVKLKSII